MRNEGDEKDLERFVKSVIKHGFIFWVFNVEGRHS